MPIKRKKNSHEVISIILHNIIKIPNFHLKNTVPIQEGNPPNTSTKQIDSKFLNQVYCHSSEKLYELPDRSVHLVVTSPPTNLIDMMTSTPTLIERFVSLADVFTECERVLVYGGLVCLKLHNTEFIKYNPINTIYSTLMAHIGYFMLGEIIISYGEDDTVFSNWAKWRYQSSPKRRELEFLQDHHEYLLIFSKGDEKRSDLREPKISKQEFQKWTNSIWSFQDEELKEGEIRGDFDFSVLTRLIKLFSKQGDIVLDPFIAKGATAIVCQNLKRNWIGYEISKEKCKVIQERLEHNNKLRNSI